MKNYRIQQHIALLAGLFLLAPVFASAQEAPRLEVIFTPDPLFSETSILPGDSVSGTVEVTNNSGEPQQVITEAINVSDPNMLSDQMHLTITDDGANTIFDSGDGTFYDFLTGGAFTLTSPLVDGDTIFYTFTVDFLEGAGNDTQKDELGFDLCVGFYSEVSGMNCGDTVVSGEGDTDGNTDTQGDGGTTVEGSGGSGGGGGGGGPIDLQHLQIENERVVSVDEVNGSALIAWETNLYSTSQVVYGLTSGGPYSLMPLSTNFGYPNATPEDTHKVLSHAVLLTGLIPGETYSFRVASRASPPTVSFEHDFVVKKAEEKTPPSPPEAGGGTSGEGDTGTDGSSNTSNGSILAVNTSGGSSGGGNTSSSPEEGTGTSTGASTTTEETTSTTSKPVAVPASPTDDSGLPLATEGLTAAAFFAGLFENDSSACILYTFIVLLVIYLVSLLYAKTAGEHARKSVKNLIWIFGLILGGITMLFFAKLCAFTFLMILLAALVIWNIYKTRKKKTASLPERPSILHKTPLN